MFADTLGTIDEQTFGLSISGSAGTTTWEALASSWQSAYYGHEPAACAFYPG
jgi:hypothetical protein